MRCPERTVLHDTRKSGEVRRTHMGIQRLRNSTPHFPQVLFTVLREEGCKGRLLGKGSRLVVGGLERVYFPLHTVS